MAAWSSTTCITFTPREDESSYVRITTDKSGCYSDYVGFLGRTQVINLQEKKCTSVGIAIHELGHVLGLWHEQSRPDRDKYVKILTKNIRAGKMRDFARRKRYEIDTHGLAYDYDSIMHYRLKAFSKNGRNTIQVANRQLYRAEGSPNLGQRNHLSRGDIAVINKFYNCRDHK